MTVLLSINSKFIHTLLSVRYLKKYLTDCVIYETNVNVPRQKVLADLYGLQPQTIAISCYIFNIEYVKSLVEDLKVLLPKVKILLGGYAADSVSDFENRHIVYGEGEHIIGAAVSGNDKLYYAPEIEKLDDIISPYDEDYISLGKKKILYFESSRGCPFNCSYCMSAGHKVRNFSLGRVFNDLDKIVDGNVMQVKFVDRTFNADLERANEIIEHIIENYSMSGTNFHFEMAPELFNDKLFKTLAKAPKGLLQVEIGVQSFNASALKECNRHYNPQVICENISRILKQGNIHIHTDLIAGLPYEDYLGFINSFDKLYSLNSDMLQLGFLKLLKGSKLAEKAAEYGYIAYATAPYEIIKSKWLNYKDILKLKTAEAALDRYHNSGKYKFSLAAITAAVQSPYEFYYGFGEFLNNNNAFEGGISAMKSADLLFEYGKTYVEPKLLAEYINADYLASGNVRKWKRVLRD